MSRNSRRAIGFDQVTGFAERVSKLRQDPESRLWTADPDKPNPQKFPVLVGRDGRSGGGEAFLQDLKIDCTVNVGYGMPWPSNGEALPVPSLAISSDVGCRYLFSQTVNVTPLTLTVLTPSITTEVDTIADVSPTFLIVDDNFSGQSWGLGGWGTGYWGGPL
jgi:hypothetical protein